MDLEALGGGAATGFVSTILTLLGWNRRISKLEEEKATKEQVLALDKKIDQVRMDLKESIMEVKVNSVAARDRLDEIYVLILKDSKDKQ